MDTILFTLITIAVILIILYAAINLERYFSKYFKDEVDKGKGWWGGDYSDIDKGKGW